tara:strand:+ start:436 stop:8124 length:7689 start_codon:yes stop_codon:yes gene_type:complete
MPQETNLNVAPYFDDFDAQSNYYKVLFKPAYPVQARELNNLQSILQDQVENVGNHFFKEGAKVIPGQTSYLSSYYAVQIEPEFTGLPVSLYLDQLKGKIVTGRTSGITAKIVNYITDEESERSNYTLYVDYIQSGADSNSTKEFFDNEILTINETISFSNTFISPGEGIVQTIADGAAQVGSAFGISSGVYFLRGYFVDVFDDTLILDQYSNTPSYRIGLFVKEELISSESDRTLNDNAQGFSNFTAPGADRLKISATLAKRDLQEFDDQNFVQIAEVRNGILRDLNKDPWNNVLRNELARRTFDESGHYYIKEFVTTVKDSLNNGFGNRGIYNADQLTDGGNKPSEDLALYKISPGKAYIKGYEIEKNGSTFLDCPKPRNTNLKENQAVNFGFGPTLRLNRVTGAANIGFDTTGTIGLRNERVGVGSMVAPGSEIGVARIYDFALESGSYDLPNPSLNQWDLSLFDVQTYTDINVNDTVTQPIPCFVEGQSSGANGFLRYEVVVGTGLTLYNTKGDFVVGERLNFNGIGTDGRTSIGVTHHSLSDVSSVFGQDTTNVAAARTFSADIIPSEARVIGIASLSVSNRSVAWIKANGGGIATVTSPSFTWPGIVTTGDIVSYSLPGQQDQCFARVSEVNTNSIGISTVASVIGVCTGALPLVPSTVTNFTLLETRLQEQVGSGNASNNESLYSVFPRKNIESVNFVDSTLDIRRQFTNVSVDANGQSSTLSAGTNEVFLSYDEERYVFVRSDGGTENLSADKLDFGTSGNTELTFKGLQGTTDTAATVITTIRKSNLTSKQKVRNVGSNTLIEYSNNSASGTDASGALPTLNDGLTFGNYPFGTRVQDSIISLNVPDVETLYAIFESDDTSDPIPPSMTVGSMDGPTATTTDLIIGEEVVGQVSGARALYMSRLSDTSIQMIYENQNTFRNGELVRFTESGISALSASVDIGSKNITGNFTFSNGQKGSIYDYARITRKSDAPTPSRKLKVYYLNATYNSSDTGDITTINSYNEFNYGTEISSVNGVRNSDIIDARPRVSDFSASAGSRSPLEFLGRSFNGGQHSSKDVIANDESFILDYTYYLPRVDRIYLDTEGLFTVKYGVPADNPVPPEGIPGALNIANAFLPAYLYNTNQVKIKFMDHKRYQMSDINRLEQRLRNVEYYTSLSRLEQNAANAFVPDANGLNRFKSGFFTDNFNDLSGQDLGVGVRNSIDRRKGELRPAHYTTAVSLEIGSDAIAGIGTTALSSDTRYANLLGNNVTRNTKNDGGVSSVLCLDYDEQEWLTQPFATRSENVTPFLVRFWQGNLELNPTADIWIDTNQFETRAVTMMGSLEGLAGAMRVELQGEPGSRSGVSPVIWGAWETTDVNVDFSLDASQETNNNTTWRQGGAGDLALISDDDWRADNTDWFADGFPETFQIAEETSSTETTISGSVGVDLNQRRRGTQNTVVEKIDTESLGSRMVSREIIHFMRSRNIEFTGRNLKPYTRIYSFFDNVDVTQWCTPKLIEISMTSGTFQVGEEVVGMMEVGILNTQVSNSGLPTFNTLVAQSNHKYGPYDDPTDTFTSNPYDRDLGIAETYSETSTILNVDTNSLADENRIAQGGFIMDGMILIGQTSGAQARVSDVRLMTDRMGTLIGSFRVPNLENTANPRFENGRNRLRLTSSPTNSKVSGLFSTSAEETFFSQGDIDNSEEVTLSLRNATVTVDTSETNPALLQNRTIGDRASASASFTTGSTEATEYRDPLAQSFVVDDTEGIFVTSVDLFFGLVDFNGPVEVEIREVQLGVPIDKRIAGSLVVLNPQDIVTSDDATVATNVRFDYPIYLNGQREYALVILSNVTDYKVWISRLGEVDVTTLSEGEAGQTLVSTQTTLGSLFKSQTGSTWTPSQYEDLKFVLNRANFVPEGDIQFFNPQLNLTENGKIKENGLIATSKDIRVGLGTTVADTGLVTGAKITQQNTTASGIFVGYGGSATGALTLINTGIGYTPLAAGQSYDNVSLTSLSGSGINGTADITIVNGVAIAATINAGGKGYAVGDVLTATSIGSTTTGSGLRLSVTELKGQNELRLVGVQGEFTTVSSDYLSYTNTSGITTVLNYAVGPSGSVIPQSPIRTENDGLHLKVYHRNHGMHATGNVVTLADVSSDVSPSTLSSAILSTSTADIGIGATTNFGQFENTSVGSTNPGYAKIGNEIIKYTGVSGATLTGISRAQNSTVAANHAVSDQIYKYELDGVSLRRINTNHNLNEVTVSDPITLDTYYVKINMAENGENRTGAAGSLPALFFNETKSLGGVDATSTYNIQFEEAIPTINSIAPSDTNITSSLRTTSGTSVDGTESSFVDKGFEDITINQPNYFDSPRIIASRINETTYLGALPGNKSLTLNMNFTTANPKLTPMVDMDQSSLKLITNRVNSPISNFATSFKVDTVVDDPCRFFYVTKNINLDNPSTSLKVILDGYISNDNDLRVFYAINQDTNVAETVFVPFPGFNNLDQQVEGKIINRADSDGRPDKDVPKLDSYSPNPSGSSFQEYQFTVDRLAPFSSFRIKIIGTSTNQAFAPRVKSLRVLALA